jgi:hypothetical protein
MPCQVLVAGSGRLVRSAVDFAEILYQICNLEDRWRFIGATAQSRKFFPSRGDMEERRTSQRFHGKFRSSPRTSCSLAVVVGTFRDREGMQLAGHGSSSLFANVRE